MWLLPILPLLALLTPSPSFAQDHQQDYLECPDSNLTTYVLGLIDVLYGNGLSIFEELIARISETDSGYTLLSSWVDSPTLTLLVPTDEAFQKAGIWGPFEHQSEKELVELVSLHTLQGSYTWGKLPEAPLHGVANSSLSIAGHVNSTDAGKGGWQSVVMVRGENNAMVVKTAYGNVTTWNGPLNVEGTEVGNLVLLPVDNIVGFPPKLSDALRIGMTTRSPSGLVRLESALSSVSAGGASALEAVTAGFTIFAPVDDAWNADVDALLKDKAAAPTLLGNHYTTAQTIFSPAWYNSGSLALVPVVSGATLSVKYNGTGSYVSLGDQTATILRSDITLENGVMHIIDRVLLASPQSTTGGGPPGLLGKPSISASASASASGARNSTGAGNSQGQNTSGAGLSRGFRGIVLAFGLAAAAVFAI